jgi:hypothetical protein
MHGYDDHHISSTGLKGTTMKPKDATACISGANHGRGLSSAPGIRIDFAR